MTTIGITYIILYSLPAYVAMICGLYLVRMAYLKENPYRLRPFILTIVLYFVSMLVWLSQILYYVLPEVYITLHSFIFLTCLLIYVFSYRFVFEITKVEPSEKFHFIHFLMPLMGFTVMLVWSFLVPRDVQLSLIRSGRDTVAGYSRFSLFFESDIPVMMCMNVVYSLLGLRRIARYRRLVVDYSADEFRGALTWLYQFIFITLALFAGVGVIYILTKIMQVSLWVILIPSLIAVLKYVILLHNILLENFVIIKTDLTDANESDPFPYENGSSPEDYSLLLYKSDKSAQDIKHLESYIQKNKPYLNPKFKITDMTLALHTNRTALSSLINSVYGMNFCRFINRYRLQELVRIKSNPANKNLSEEELANLAGFSDYRGYLRVKFREEINSSDT